MSAFHGASDPASSFPAAGQEGEHSHGPFAALSHFAAQAHSVGEAGDAMDIYFECITTCSLEDGECITRCVEELREHA